MSASATQGGHNKPNPNLLELNQFLSSPQPT